MVGTCNFQRIKDKSPAESIGIVSHYINCKSMVVLKTNPTMKQLVVKSWFFFFFLLASQSVSAHKKSFNQKEPCKRFVLYYHDILFNGTDSANATSAAATEPTELNKFNFGMLVVFDDPMTKRQQSSNPFSGTSTRVLFL